jgi:hypothetical protein
VLILFIREVIHVVRVKKRGRRVGVKRMRVKDKNAIKKKNSISATCFFLTRPKLPNQNSSCQNRTFTFYFTQKYKIMVFQTTLEEAGCQLDSSTIVFGKLTINFFSSFIVLIFF